jgi:hypothetical protein
VHCGALASQNVTTPGKTGVAPCNTAAVIVIVVPAFTEAPGEIVRVVAVAAGINAPMVVASVALSFTVLLSPPPETAAVFVTLAAALLPTFTVKVIAG